MRRVGRSGSFFTSVTLYRVTVKKMDGIAKELGLSRSGIIRLACQWSLNQKDFLKFLRDSVDLV
jgi:hypothetical protein